MERLFKTHNVRVQEELDGIWEFQCVEAPQLPEHYDDIMPVPACWETTIKYCAYTGYAAYRKRIYVNKTGSIRLLFKGVSHTGTIYFDGKKIGFHYNAYTPFSIAVPYVPKGEHTIEVLVDNSYSDHSKLHFDNDYFTYGGITRSALMEYVPECYIERAEFIPIKNGDRWYANVKIAVRNLSNVPVSALIKTTCARKEVCISGELAPLSCTVTSVNEWSNEAPNLYELCCLLYTDGKLTDDFIDRVGFREIKIVGKHIELNGKRIFLKGVNRHEDHGICGCAIPLASMYTDIALIKDLGANAVRTSHYPNDEKFLDLCDEKGIFIWEESHMRGGDTARITNPLFIGQSMAVMREMLECHCNHPSIIIWGCLNEAASDTKAGREIYKKHLSYLASDASRPHTYASNKHTNDICLDLEDICSFNIYPLWYDDKTTDWTLKRIKKHMSETGNDGKPLIISEYGGGAVYGFHDIMKVKWSEEYQAELLETVTNELLADEDISGIFIWQFCDTRIKGERFNMTRPKCRNNKGLVDEFRRPKMAYYAVKNIYSKY